MVDPSEMPSMVVYICSTCARRCLVVGNMGEPRCICGGDLTRAVLSPGQYEIIGQSAVDSTRVDKAKQAPELTHPAEKEADLGYGQSHGYDITHGGPSGPGDAPAKRSGA